MRRRLLDLAVAVSLVFFATTVALWVLSDDPFDNIYYGSARTLRLAQRLIVFLIAPAAVGLVLLIVGLRGQKIDDHPICRRCGFDLLGLPKGVAVCSECGADLVRRRAIRDGHRQRRPWVALVGALPLLLMLGAGGLVGWTHLKAIDVQRMTPTSWLMRDAGQKTPVTSIAAMNELARRFRANKFPAAQAGDLADLALRIQGDATRPWNSVFGEFIEAARREKMLTDAQWVLYARQAYPPISVQARQKVRRGDPLPISLTLGPARAASGSRLIIRTRTQVAGGGLIAPYAKTRGYGFLTQQLSSAFSGSTDAQAIQLDPKAVANADLGVKNETIEAQVEIRDGGDYDAAAIATWTEKLTASWELVSEDAATVEVINDPAYRKGVEKSLIVQYLRYEGPDSRSLRLFVRFGKLPMPLAYEVFLRTPDGTEECLGGLAAFGTMPGRELRRETKNRITGKVDLIFRPSLKTARETIAITKMWNGEVVIRDVPVTPWEEQRPQRPGAPIFVR